MPEQRHVFRLGRSLVVAVPAAVREHLGVDRGAAVYWHLTRGGEAVVSTAAARSGGRPEGLALERKLRAAEAELVRLRQRNEARDRTMYAEGWNAGAITTQERLMRPQGASSERARRRKLYGYVFPDAADQARRTRRRRARATETAPGPDHYPAPDPSPSPALVEGEALAPGAKPTGQP
jgi:antitoxin component of MazEF toxin-antitoxin module